MQTDEVTGTGSTGPGGAGAAGGAAGAAGTGDERIGLLAQLREDVAVNGGALRPGTHAVVVHRLGAWARSEALPAWARPVGRKLGSLGHVVVRNLYGIELPPTTVLGRRVRIAHQNGIVVHPRSRIGDDCIIRQGVSIGAGMGDGERFAQQAPVLGRGVSVGAGAVVVGGVTVGDDAVIGPNATVMTNVKPNVRVLAPPPRMMALPEAVARREQEARGR
ncbi:LbetaH domain-containing protein [Kineococcus auxinigenes]|uniref:serine acetyltransferase n=1 Tax=unclassified Kineococcus TaxID=2621656 RepID=UPI003D7E5072